MPRVSSWTADRIEKGLQNGHGLPDIPKNPNRFNEPHPLTSNPRVTGCTRTKSFVQSSTMPSNQFATEQLPRRMQPNELGERASTRSSPGAD